MVKISKRLTLGMNGELLSPFIKSLIKNMAITVGSARDKQIGLVLTR